MKKVVRIFRVVAVAEGISFLVLLLVAMPLKYYFGIPEAVKYTGWAHGLLFTLYLPLLLLAAKPLKWGFFMVVAGFLASLLPGGTFVLDRKIARSLAGQQQADTYTKP